MLESLKVKVNKKKEQLFLNLSYNSEEQFISVEVQSSRSKRVYKLLLVKVVFFFVAFLFGAKSSLWPELSSEPFQRLLQSWPLLIVSPSVPTRLRVGLASLFPVARSGDHRLLIPIG